MFVASRDAFQMETVVLLRLLVDGSLRSLGIAPSRYDGRVSMFVASRDVFKRKPSCCFGFWSMAACGLSGSRRRGTTVAFQ